MVDRATLWSFVDVLRQHWFAAMSGGFSVPFTAAAVYFDSKYAQSIFGFLALASLYFAAFRIWKSEHDKVVTLEAAVKAASNADTRSIELAGIIKAMMEKALRHGFRPDDSFREFYATIDASTHPVWVADDVNQLRRDFLNRCGILGSDVTSCTLAEIRVLHKEAKEFGDTLIGRLTGAPKPSPLNLAFGTVSHVAPATQ
jgi:hypothetical protein